MGDSREKRGVERKEKKERTGWKGRDGGDGRKTRVKDRKTEREKDR